MGNVYFFSLHSLDEIYVAAAIYLHGEVMLDIYYNDLYMEIHFNCFTVLFSFLSFFGIGKRKTMMMNTF